MQVEWWPWLVLIAVGQVVAWAEARSERRRYDHLIEQAEHELAAAAQAHKPGRG